MENLKMQLRLDYSKAKYNGSCAKVKSGRMLLWRYITVPATYDDLAKIKYSNILGYGAKLLTNYKIKIGKKLYRVYCTQYGNSGTCWIERKRHGKVIRYIVDKI